MDHVRATAPLMLVAAPMPSEPPRPLELTVLQPVGRPERADAARNREKILCEAARLFAERGVENVSMDEIAAVAHVGKGTLYRRFGDRSGLALALLDEEAAALQEQIIRGDAPLGPGAPPQERLVAFFAALAEHMVANRGLVLDAERGAPDDFRVGPMPAYHTHVRLLLTQLAPHADADVLAHVLMAPFRGTLFLHLTDGGSDAGRERLLAAVDDLLGALAER